MNKPFLSLLFQHAWPRTPTERLMTDLQGTAAKFLAILEALSETHRRTLHCEAPTPDAEDTAIDVCAELFFAGMEIIAGGGGIKQAVKHDGVIHPSVLELQNTSIMELVTKGRFEMLSTFSSLTFFVFFFSTELLFSTPRLLTIYYRPSIGQQSTECRPTIDRVWTDYIRSVDPVLTDISVEYRSTLDRSIDRYISREYLP